LLRKRRNKKKQKLRKRRAYAQPECHCRLDYRAAVRASGVPDGGMASASRSRINNRSQRQGL
jgi:hypothetical protein